ncbi:MAG: hypothetical protein BGO41_12905 [Clostridiales bacterium 38-18]|nr:MAG: hypothetical protein BGO41_12905 [Clostridiales bacterium 38-18]
MKTLIIEESKALTLVAVADLKSKEIYSLDVFNHFKKTYEGNLYTGKVVQIVEALNGIFIDIGLKDNAFIQKKELIRALGISYHDHKDLPIGQFVKKGQMVLVQVEKEPYQTKGAGLTGDFSLPGEFVILMPRVKGIKVSKKIRQRADLEQLVIEVEQASSGYGVILRSSLENDRITLEMILKDLSQLISIWKDIELKSRLSSKIMLHFEKNKIIGKVETVIKAFVPQQAIVNEEKWLPQLKTLGFTKESVNLLATYSIFNENGINLNRYMNHKIFSFENGIWITIEESEAFTIIDVNSGSYDSNKDKESHIYEVNKIAAAELLKILQLKNLSGVILIDFIDMLEAQRIAFIKELQEIGYNKSNEVTILGFTRLGILELTKKRVSPSLMDLLSMHHSKQDLNYYHLHQLELELNGTASNTNTKRLRIDLDEDLYLLLRQHDVLKEIKIVLDLNSIPINEKKYKLHSLKH